MNHDLLFLAGGILFLVVGFFCVVLMAADEWRQNRPHHRRFRKN